MTEKPSPLTPADIAAMRAHLESNPPRVGPPPERPYWDVWRIVVTLEGMAAENARLRTSTREAWDTAHRSGKGEWGEFTDAEGGKWVVRYWADERGWIVTTFRQDGEGPRQQCCWTDLPEGVRALAVERLGIKMPECQVRTVPTGGKADHERARTLATAAGE